MVVVATAREWNQRARARSGTGRWDDQERGLDGMAWLVLTGNVPAVSGKGTSRSAWRELGELGNTRVRQKRAADKRYVPANVALVAYALSSCNEPI